MVMAVASTRRFRFPSTERSSCRIDKRSMEGNSVLNARGSEERIVGLARDARRRYDGKDGGMPPSCGLLSASSPRGGVVVESVSLDWLDVYVSSEDFDEDG